MTHHDDARLDDLLAQLGNGDSRDLFRRLLERGMQDLIARRWWLDVIRPISVLVITRGHAWQTNGAMKAQVGHPNVVASSQLIHLVGRGNDPSVHSVQKPC